jgi:TPR repeat protein
MNRQTRWRFLCFVGLLSMSSCTKLPPDQEHFSKGYAAYNKGDFATALLYLKPLVETGNPAAELLMAKMYTNGDGVPFDMEKSEYLRNAATIEIFKKKNLTPGEVNPLGGTLANIAKRLDYYENGSEGKSESVKDLSDVLKSVDARNMADLQGHTPDQDGEPAEHPVADSGGAPPDTTVEVPQTLGEKSSIPPSSTMAISDSSRGSDQISLSILHQSAEAGDPMAMEFLSAAYAHGFYRVKPSPVLAKRWADKAKKARQRKVPDHRDASTNNPIVQVRWILGIGFSLMGIGAWLWWRDDSR